MSHTEQMREALLDDLAKWEAHVRRYDVDGACNPLANTLQQARAALTAPAAEVPEAMGDEQIDAIVKASNLGGGGPFWPDNTGEFARAMLAARQEQPK